MLPAQPDGSPSWQLGSLAFVVGSSSSDDVDARKAQRKARNRKAAAASRDRKKEQLELLHLEVEKLRSENAGLRRRLEVSGGALDSRRHASAASRTRTTRTRARARARAAAAAAALRGDIAADAAGRRLVEQPRPPLERALDPCHSQHALSEGGGGLRPGRLARQPQKASGFEEHHRRLKDERA
ncbi:hypothetical protein EMIHUDRAFT_444416 [Emiliania huxleyi CCMP1516]|uniref:BZIP domain-containing protein n=2 Tax=Emiliania huxleyi TaxID=2903 RepID=A0A0D3JDM6_EMIH1|nr:hypothetical protein EMIHUDRAFT_444416 [Emiliania huxleyi CCMP1516]EOD21611.1 hypothetical protein EMIHUDRAFT_444416 [Emiliania huxleyi CCMP1516]|eukprot:XP_005774040.1 hypothetical protein EMIHUDRAFT_444416 [Emiliania huxleyi CCMP1516]